MYVNVRDLLWFLFWFVPHLSGHAKRKDDQLLEFSIMWLRLSEAFGLLSSCTASFPIEQPGIYEEKEISIPSVAISRHCRNAGPLVLKGKSPLHCPQSRTLAVHEENIAASANGWIQGTRISGCCSVIPSPSSLHYSILSFSSWGDFLRVLAPAQECDV